MNEESLLAIVEKLDVLKSDLMQLIEEIKPKPSSSFSTKEPILPNGLDINSESWPMAVLDSSIVKTAEQKTTRAVMMASKLPKLSGKVLDFGCGEGYLVEHFRNQDIDIVGYDSKAYPEEWRAKSPYLFNDWDKVKSFGKYDFIILYDVIDHVVHETVNQVIDKVKSVLSNNGTICIFAHPWTSIHGGHIYETFNKAYAHLLMDDDVLDKLCPDRPSCIKVTRPMAHYKTTIEDKFLVISKKAVNNPPNSWIVENLVPIISAKVFDDKLPPDQVIKILSLSGIYYQVTH